MNEPPRETSRGLWFSVPVPIIKLFDVCLVCVFITAVPSIKLFACGEGDSGGHVLCETTSRGLCGLVCPSRTSERGGEGYGVNQKNMV